MFDSAWPAICARFGYVPFTLRWPGGSCMRPAPITRMRLAPRCTAGEMGALWRMEPSPKYSVPPSKPSCTGGNTNGMAAEASRCGTVMVSRTATRCERFQGTKSFTES